MQDFIYTGQAARVVFGRGTTSQLPQELDHLDISRPLVLTTPRQEQKGQALLELLEGKGARVFSGATMHTPTDVTERALQYFNETGSDGIVAFGGGSTIGLGKALALRTGAPQIALPTTYAGSEMTPILGQTEDGRKTTIRSGKVLPETVIYDVEHTLDLPLRTTSASSLNAIAHAVEALYAEGSNPVHELIAEEGASRLFTALGKLQNDPRAVSARSDALLGAWLCATCLGSVGVALHHKLCHVLGGSFNLPHAETHAIVLPHALAYNAPAVPNAISILKRALKTDHPAVALFNAARQNSVPTALKDLGAPESVIDEAVDITLENPYSNPRKLEAEGLRKLLRNAWEGNEPDA